jgi:hypothetical protein
MSNFISDIPFIVVCISYTIVVWRITGISKKEK